MSIWRQVLRRNHLQRFVDVARRDGLPRAIGRAHAQIQVLRRGGTLTELVPGEAGAAGRFSRSALWADLARQKAFHAGPAPARLARKRSVALIGDLNLPQCRKYRVEQMAEFWAGLGVGYRYAHIEDVPRCLDILQDASHLVLYRVERSDLLSMYLYEARRLKLPIVYDIDDPLFSVPALAGYSNLRALGPVVTAQHIARAPLYLDALSMADAVTVSTPGLARAAEAFTHRPVWLRRNFADRETLSHCVRPFADTDFDLALVSGSKGRQGDMHTLGPVLAAELKNNPSLRVLCLGHTEGLFQSASLGQVEHRPYSSYRAYLNSLSRARAVVVPLSDDPFNACKSSVRALDAAAAGRPVIAAPVGDFPVVVREGATGLLAASTEELQNTLSHLVAHPDQASEMGREARRSIEQNWTVRNILNSATSELAGWVVQ